MTSKSAQAALLAQELGSERSWADRFAPSPPHTRIESTADATATSSRMAATLQHQQIPSEPPPAYEDITNVQAVELPADVPPTALNTIPPALNISDPDDTASLQLGLDPTRCYSRHERFGSISGVFTFFDFLELSADHGSISITLDPKPGDAPAILRLTALHGAIQVKLSDSYLEHLTASGKLSRPWDVRIRAKAGAVDAKLPIGCGSTIFLKSRWGAVSSTFYVADPGVGETFSEVKVETHNGAQGIKFVPLHGMSPIRNIAGDYHSKMSGAIKVEYPETWEGRIQAKSTRGKVKVEGDNLQTQHYGSREIHASRGVAQLVTSIQCDGVGRARVKC